MKKSWLWYLLPIMTLWACFYIGHSIIDGGPFDDWYNVPAMITMLSIFIASFVYGVDKAVHRSDINLRGEDKQ